MNQQTFNQTLLNKVVEIAPHGQSRIVGWFSCQPHTVYVEGLPLMASYNNRGFSGYVHIDGLKFVEK